MFVRVHVFACVRVSVCFLYFGVAEAPANHMGFADTVAILAQGMSPGLRSRVLGLLQSAGSNPTGAFLRRVAIVV